MQNKWTDSELQQAFYLYCVLPFGKLHSKTAQIIALAQRIGRTPSAVAMKLVNFASLDTAITGTGRKGLSGASANDKKIWAQFHANWEALIEKCAELDNLTQQPIFSLDIDSEQNLPTTKLGTDVRRETKVRIGQQFFRQSVLSNYKNMCCITGLDIPKLLVASHIKPWSIDAKNRLNPRNGLCLSNLHDKAFDLGLISLDDNYSVIVSSSIRDSLNPFVGESLSKFEGYQIHLPDKFAPDPTLIRHHRETIFKH